MRHLVTELCTNDYDDYLATGQPLKTDDDLKVFAGRYLCHGSAPKRVR
jgi:hypothetical protein